MRACSEEYAAWFARSYRRYALKAFGVVNFDAAFVAHRQPDFLATWLELHVQYALAGFEFLYHGERLCIDHLDRIVVGQGEIDPDMAAVRACHNEYRLAMYLDASGLLPVTHVNDQHFVTPDGGYEGEITGHCPALEVRHLVYRQFLLTFAVAR